MSKIKDYSNYTGQAFRGLGVVEAAKISDVIAETIRQDREREANEEISNG